MKLHKADSATLIADRVRKIVAAATGIWHALMKDSPGVYRPELHYMRGPGPKWREKHADPRQ